MDLVCIGCAKYDQFGKIDASDVLYVQCKVRKELMRPKEVKELVQHANRYNGRAILAYKDKKGHIITEVLN